MSIIVLCCCYLHNYISRKNPTANVSSNVGSENVTNSLDAQLDDLEPLRGGNVTGNAKEIRNKFCNFFNTVGAVPWQDERI